MSKLRLTTGTSPATPPALKVDVYPKLDNLLYYKNSTGTEYGPLGIGGGGGIVGPPNYVYLTPTGVDGSAARGDASKPFGTLKGAFNACLTGDVLVIGAGTYTIAVVGDIPVWNPALTKLTILGAGLDVVGLGGTVIKNVIGDASHIFAPPNTVSYLEIRNLYASTSGTGRPLFCDGTGGAGAYLGGTLNGSLRLVDCAFLNTLGFVSATFKYVGLANMHNVYFEVGGNAVTEIVTSNFLGIADCTFGKLSFDRNAGDANKPSAFLTVSEFYNCIFHSGTTLDGQAQIQFHDCDLKDVLGGTLTAIAGSAPRIKIYGGFAENIDFQGPGHELPDTAEVSKGFEIHGTWVNSSLKVKVAGALNRFPVDVRGSDLSNVGANNIIADVGIDLDARGTNYSLDGSQFLTLGSGKLHVNRIDRIFTTSGASPEPVNFTAPGTLTFVSAPDSVFVTPKSLAAGFLGTTFYTPTAFTLAYSINGTPTDIVCSAVWR